MLRSMGAKPSGARGSPGNPGCAPSLWVVALLFVLLPYRAVAASSTAAEPEANMRTCLYWTKAQSNDCPDEERIAASVHDIVGYPPFVPSPCDRMIRGRIERRDSSGEWLANLSLETSDGSPLGDRQLVFKDDQCVALADPIALVMALMLEANHAHAILMVPIATPTAPSSVQHQGFGRRSHTFAGLGASWGLLPDVSLGPHLGFGLSLSRLVSMQVEGSVWLPASNHSTDRGGEFWAWYAGTLVCPRITTAGVSELSVCAGAQAGKVYGSGVGLDYDLSPNRPYLQGEVRVQGSVTLFGPLALSAYFDSAVPMVRPRFVYEEPPGPSREVHRPNAVVLSGGIGLDLTSILAAKAGAN
jgi:hypothetical protein